MTNMFNKERIKEMAARMWRIVTVAVASFQQEGAARGAAGTAYYTLFSFFPLLNFPSKVPLVNHCSCFNDFRQFFQEFFQ